MAGRQSASGSHWRAYTNCNQSYRRHKLLATGANTMLTPSVFKAMHASELYNNTCLFFIILPYNIFITSCPGARGDRLQNSYGKNRRQCVLLNGHLLMTYLNNYNNDNLKGGGGVARNRK